MNAMPQSGKATKMRSEKSPTLVEKIPGRHQSLPELRIWGLCVLATLRCVCYVISTLTKETLYLREILSRLPDQYVNAIIEVF